jgi:hypothetical protein
MGRRSKKRGVYSALSASSDLSDNMEGRQAAEKLCESWPDTDWVPQNPSLEWAHGAIAEFAEIIRRQPSIFRASQRGAEVGASMLSPRPFQGLSEALQNADDLGASELRIGLRHSPRQELLIIHNGKPVSLAHLGAMVLPWLSTKAADGEASGRFGIGQKTLKSLGGPLEMHCPPFHFVMLDEAPEIVEPAKFVEGVYDPQLRETMLVVPLHREVDVSDIPDAVESLGVDSLKFLRHIQRLSYVDLDTLGSLRSYSIHVEPARDVEAVLNAVTCSVRHNGLVIEEPTELAGLKFDRYWTELPVTAGEARRNKATGKTTPLGICVSADLRRGGALHDRIPLPIEIASPISLNSQFDPDGARSTILATSWNKRRLADLGHLLGAVALDAFEREPAAAWTHVPLTTERLEAGDWIKSAFAKDVVETCHKRLRSDLRLPARTAKVDLSQIVYEDARLDGLLTPEDLELLAPGRMALDPMCRDGDGRWRLVLDDLEDPQALDPEDSLELFDHADAIGDREPSWFISMAALALEQGLWGEFLKKDAFLLADGTIVECPPRGGPRILVLHDNPHSLARRLGLALPLHQAYQAENPDAEKVIAKLREMRILREACDEPAEALQLLARSNEDAVEPVRLENDDLIALRDAWVHLSRVEQRTMGAKIGSNIELRTITYEPDSQRPEKAWARPHEAYLPAQIGRETDSFAKAAARTPGLVWVDPEYAKLLKHERGRGKAGAQRFLSALGVARDPRLIVPLNEKVRWSRDTRPASSVAGVSRPEAQLRAIRAGGYGEHYLLDDRWSSDLEAVVEDIQSGPARFRKRRGLALLAVLSRGWERRYSEYQISECVVGYNGYWTNPREVQATWLARLSAAVWLPNGNGALRAPSQLALPTEANRLTYGTDKGAYLTKYDQKAIRPDLLKALGIKLGPSGDDLIERLQDLREKPLTQAITDQVHTIYQLLAADLRSNTVDLKAGRALTPQRLRNAFRASPGRDGLLLADDRWHSPEAVLRGPRIFGEYRVFAPHIAGLEPLWASLAIPEPSAKDCVEVLREITRKSTLSPSDRGVMVMAFRSLASLISGATPQLRSTLRRLPLWTGNGWATTRPVYVLDGEAIAQAEIPGLTAWRLGLSSFTDVQPLFEFLGVTHLRLENFRPKSLSTAGILEGENKRKLFAEAVALLADELIRTDIDLHESLNCSWEELMRARLVIDPSLEITAELEGHPAICIPARAHMMSEPMTMIVRTLEDAGSSDAGGQAVASLFDGDRQKLAWAWASVWQKANQGWGASQILLPSTKPDAADNATRLAALQAQASERNESQKKTQKPSRGKPAAHNQTPVQVRKLRDIEDLEPTQGSIVNEGASGSGVIFVKSRTKGQASRTFASGSGSNVCSANPALRTVLPPVSDREQLALEAVRRALRLDPEQIQDVRSRRGIGVDAIDELRQCYEIKMSSGSAFPTDITLTLSEVEAAQNDPDFFLAIVAGLEEGDGCLKVRFIFNPLEQLAAKIRGEVTLTGVDKAKALEYEFPISDLE